MPLLPRPRFLLSALACGLSLSGVSTLVMADVLPPEIGQLQQRARENPKAFDRGDQFCVSKHIGSPCEIPGNPLEGGGKGVCVQKVNKTDQTLDAICEVPEPQIDRAIPESRYQVDARVCGIASSNPGMNAALQGERAGCEPVPPVADRFCNGKQPGDACKVDLVQQGQRGSYPGRCTSIIEEKRFYMYGHQTKRRTVLTCQAEKPLVRNLSKPSTGWLQRLTR